MEQQQKHSVQGYLTRLPTDKLELLWHSRHNTGSTLLTPADYDLILDLLRSRPDSSLFVYPVDIEP